LRRAPGLLLVRITMSWHIETSGQPCRTLLPRSAVARRAMSPFAPVTRLIQQGSKAGTSASGAARTRIGQPVSIPQCFGDPEDIGRADGCATPFRRSSASRSTPSRWCSPGCGGRPCGAPGVGQGRFTEVPVAAAALRFPGPIGRASPHECPRSEQLRGGDVAEGRSSRPRACAAA
jgi:hypothetical protein